MKCPKCEVVELTMAERSAVEIDYCSVCRGVWLDRGELDKIVERAALVDPYAERRPREDDRDHDDDDRDRGRKRRRGFLGDLFDF
jgi:Zn-finger nucleic acid-binding protein